MSELQRQQGKETAVHEMPSALRRIGVAISPKRISGVYVWLGLIIFYSLMTSTFLSWTTGRTIANEQAVTAIAAIGLTVPLAAGHFDISLASMIGLANVVVAKLMVDGGMSPPEAILLTLLLGLIVGAINGFLVAVIRIESIIATLGTSSIITAFIVVVSGNTNVVGIPPSFTKIGTEKLLGLPLPFYYMLALAIIVWYVLSWTPVGRKLYATGGNEEVARLAGVKTRRYLIGSFMTSSLIASIAGVTVVGILGTGSVEVGPTYLLATFAACFLGATQIRPGRFNVWGTVLAVYLLATGVKGLVLMGAEAWVQELFNGVALLVAVGIAGFQRKAKVKKAKSDDQTRNVALLTTARADAVEGVSK